MPKKTPLNAAHHKANANMVNFADWEMPLNYGSQLIEHHAVRKNSGVFDVSHMAIIDFNGPESIKVLQYLLSTDVNKLAINKGAYCCLLNHKGGIKDDLIVYRYDNSFRLVVNAATREKDLAWFKEHCKTQNVNIEERTDLAMLAIQGPKIREKIPAIFPKNMQSAISALTQFTTTSQSDWQIARTGYTGEDGFEVILPNEDAIDFWNTLLAADIQPCGLGARDTLRLEAGLNLYGADMDENTSPLESGLTWTIDFKQPDRNFIGKVALQTQQETGIKYKRAGLVVNQRVVIRNSYNVQTEYGAGKITSGGFSPTLNFGIALARIPLEAKTSCEVTIRGKKLLAQIIRPPFIRYNKPNFVESFK